MQSLRRNIIRSKFVKQYLQTAIVFTLLLFNLKVNAQNYPVQLHFLEKTIELENPKIEIPTNEMSEVLLNKFCRELIVKLQQQGYLTASIDSIVVREKVWHVYFYYGQKYQLTILSFASVPKSLLKLSGIIPDLFYNKKIEPRELVFTSEKLLTAAENNGFPFAQLQYKVGFDSLKNINIVSLELYLGKETKLDTVFIQEEAKVSRKYILQYLSLKEHEKYNQHTLNTISAKIKSNPFLQEKKSWEVAFTKAQTSLKLYLEEKKSNQFDAIIGWLPNVDLKGKMLFTVDALLSLKNSFGYGEQFDFTYQNLQYQSPKLKFEFQYPFLFNAPIGVDVHFELFKKDSAYQKSFFQSGLRYQFHGNEFVRLFFQLQSNRLITVDTNWIISNKMLPLNIDVTAIGLGAEICLNRTNNYLNPSSGWEFQLSCTQLKSVIKKNATIENIASKGFDFSTLYDSSNQNREQWFIKLNSAYFFKVKKQLVIKTSFYSGLIHSNNLFQNELFQIGGHSLLRGFNEHSIFAKEYYVFSGELRVAIDERSYIYLFNDIGYIQSIQALVNYRGWYHGLGIGLVLKVKSGVLDLAYSIGSLPENSIAFKNSKIHFGYVTNF